MKYPLLKTYINQYSKNIIVIIKYWLKNKDVLKILKSNDVKPEIFVKKYAIAIIEYYINIVNEKKIIGDCPTIEEFLLYLKDKNVSIAELFIICSSFKNALIEFTYDLKITNLQIEKEINYIFEKNFAGVLEKFSNSTFKVQDELSKKSTIIDKYVIMSKTDISGKIIDVSEAFCNISGYSEKELLGQYHSILRHPTMPSELFEELWSTIKSGNPWQGEIKNLKKDGTYYWVKIIISPLFNSNNKIIAFEAIRQDITHQKELEEQQSILVEQSKAAAMGEMISMIAHQWRQPLQAVSILIQKLPLTKMIEGKISDELLEEVVDGIGNQLNYMSKTIDDFRDFFLPDKPKELVNISSVINRALEFVSFLLKSKSVSINLEIRTEKEIIVHVNELVQVLINLFKNACDIMSEKEVENKEINIVVFEENKYLVIEIEDNAGGVPANIINKIFEPYFSTKNDKNGTGLGLYMCKTIIEKHSNGKITVSNSDKGAIFKIELPLNLDIN